MFHCLELGVDRVRVEDAVSLVLNDCAGVRGSIGRHQIVGNGIGTESIEVCEGEGVLHARPDNVARLRLPKCE